MDYALNSPKHTQHTNTYIPTHTICHTVCGLCDLPAILSLMLIQTPSQSYWHVWETETEYYHHPLLPRLKSMNRLCVFTVYCFFFVLQEQTFLLSELLLGRLWPWQPNLHCVCAGALSSPLPLCHLWQLNWRSALIVSHTSCPSPRVQEAPGGQPAHSAVCLPAHKHPIINNDLKPHGICCMNDVDFIAKHCSFGLWSTSCEHYDEDHEL